MQTLIMVPLQEEMGWFRQACTAITLGRHGCRASVGRPP
jgi:hypothetical protein